MFGPGGARPRNETMIGIVEDHRAGHMGPGIWVGPICPVPPIAPSGFCAHPAIARDPGRASGRARRDARSRSKAQRVWNRNVKVHGVGKLWHQIRREALETSNAMIRSGAD